ncbi:tyrosine-type recombinase/integrase (plasmid) [Spirosoma taeanense]|uniref:Tyrosine-type recombinase/integrase n=1 Tax=Spirosoma taeanense TaxID=2735870 RepID=A0A6M5YGW5_9BACT|nr:tyrosine-type recombinase/integrase [Spirosoma taeanense]QJW92493.1 tyrosine-type recombinase/integrase [Spirosoma taeanense]
MEELKVEFHTAEEQAAIIANLKNPEHKVIALLMLDTGGRVSEVCKLTWEKCDFRAKTVTIKTSKQRGKEKARCLPMSERLYAAFDELVKQRNKEGAALKGFVFPGNDRGHIYRTAPYMMLKRLQAKAPQVGDVRPHKLRHTFATNLVAQGTELIDIRNMLGHSDSRVTEIYTHTNPERLRAQINASAPRPSVFERLKARLLPKQRTLINLVITDVDFIVGREKEQKQIQSLISRGISVLITGAIGAGKTHLLQSLNFDKPTLVIDDASDFKKSITAAILHICGDKETAAAMLFKTSDLKAVETKLSTSSLPNLVQTLKDCTQPNEYLLKIGNIDGVTPKGVKILEDLKDHFTIITTARGIKMEAASFAWSFEKIELQPLTRPDSLRMIYRLIGDLQTSELDAVMTKIYETSDGNPRKIKELCERLRREPFVNLDSATEVADSYLGRQVEEFDFSIILLVILGGFVLMRYYGRVTGEKDLQFIGACIMFVLMFARYLFKSARRKTL